jgi:hypothetical protein
MIKRIYLRIKYKILFRKLTKLRADYIFIDESKNGLDLNEIKI